jgi:hypothetical protein
MPTSMNIRIFAFIIVSILFLSFGHSQTGETSNLEEKYDKYFKAPRESLYLHLNKSSYLRGENLWFQGYAYNRQTKQLHSEVRNVELRIYNDQGNMLDKQLLLCIGGRFSGQIEIDSTYIDGNYYLKAETNWMKNFKEDYAHVQQFEIIGSKPSGKKSESKAYDLQILPEGGHLVRGIKSRIGIKLLNDKGLGVNHSGVLTEDGNEVFNFKSNQFGHASIYILPKKKSNYKLKLNLPNGHYIEKEIKGIEDNGIVLNVNNNLKDKILVSVQSNLKRNKDYHNTSLEILIHKEGNRFKIPIELSEKTKSVIKTIDKKSLFYGVNTFTLLLNGKPIAERLIFSDAKSINNKNDVNIYEMYHNSQDSLSLKLDFPEHTEKKYLSISILPINTISYQKNKNIISSLLLEPYVNGYIENASYYFTNPSKKKYYHLDLLLLNQGWSRYEWKNILDSSPKIYYERKDGLNQNIGLNGKIPNNVELLLLSNTIYNDDKLFKLDTTKVFKIENRYPLKGEKINLSFIDKNNEFKEPKAVLTTQLSFEDKGLDTKYFTPSIADERNIKLNIDKNKIYSNFKSEEELDEVLVYVKSDKVKDENSDPYANLLKNKVEINEEIANQYTFLSNFLRAKGYRVRENIGEFSIVDLRGQRPLVIIDGIFMEPSSLSTVLGRTYTGDYESISFNKTGAGFGIRGSNGVINIKTRKTPLNKSSNLKLPYKQIEVKKGFEPPKRFYMPKYAFFKTESFQQVGTIAWFSNVVVQKGESLELDILDTGLYKMNLYIEGIGEDGSIINIVKQFGK